MLRHIPKEAEQSPVERRAVEFPSQIRQVILYLLLAQLSEPWTYRTMHSLVAQQVICRIANDANLDSVAVHFTFDGLFEC